MIFINEYLRSHKKDIVDYIQGNYIPASIISNSTFNSLATELQRKFVHDHRGHIGGRDEAHNVLSMAIMCSMWCGWLSQAKTNKKAYSPEWVDNFRSMIIDAFEIGRNYATDRP
jgi:hypothetical protein